MSRIYNIKGFLEDVAIVDGATTENGFVNRTSSTISFTDNTRTLTLTPVGAGYEYWSGGVEWVGVATKTIQISATEGLHFVYLANETLAETTVFTDDLIISKTLVASLYWDNVNAKAILINDERHGRVMDSQTHLYRHDSAGASYDSGLALVNMSVDGTGDDAANARFGVENGIIWDEDIEHALTTGAPQVLANPAEIPLYYRLGASGLWRLITATTYPVTTTGTGRAAWNQLTGGAWQLTEVTNVQFVLMHYFATGCLLSPFIGLVGQADYTTVALARAGALVELNTLALGGISALAAEFVPVATVIWQSNNAYGNAVKSRVRLTDAGTNFVDWRIQRSGKAA